MHWLDRLVGTLIAPRKPSLRFFHGGWGDPVAHARLQERFGGPPADFNVEVRWDRAFPEAGGLIRDGQFESPAEQLPPGTRSPHVRLLVPAGPCERVCLLMAAWNDHGFDDRGPLARRLARLGVATLMFENPYFGRRRPVGVEGHPVATVADFGIMGLAAYEEGRALLRWLGDYGLPGVASVRPTIGVAGYSMGGNVAAAISAGAPFPVATAALGASHSPAPVVTNGALSLVVDWDALADRDDPAAELEAFLAGMDVLDHPTPPHTAQAVLVAGRADGFIPVEAVEALHRHWPGSKLTWTDEGHATLRFLRNPTLARAIVESFDRFEAVHASQPTEPAGI